MSPEKGRDIFVVAHRDRVRWIYRQREALSRSRLRTIDIVRKGTQKKETVWELTMAAIEDDGESNTRRQWRDENPVKSVTRYLTPVLKVNRTDSVVVSTFAVAIWIGDLSSCISDQPGNFDKRRSTHRGRCSAKRGSHLGNCP
jgi:hypothetical protein